ncbi:MAG: S1C family serine protease [Acidimicrobiales bacterium]
MDHGHDPHGAGDDPDEDPPPTPWLPPDDRLWRHPSEVRAHPAAEHRGTYGGAGRWAAGPARLFFVGLGSGVVGALVSAAILVSTGLVAAPAPVTTTAKPIVKASDPTKALAGPFSSLTALLGNVERSVVEVTVSGGQGTLVESGVIVSTSGQDAYVVSDSALLAEAGATPAVQVTTYLGETKTASVVEQDPSAGIAVLKVALTPIKSVDPADPGSVAGIANGEPVFSVGSQLAATSSNPTESYFGSGYMNDTAAYFPPENGAPNAMYWMLTANMTVGTSGYGGALVDGSGDVLGIVNQVPGAPPGSTYVTPIDTVSADVALVKTGKPAPHPWLGVLDAADITVSGRGNLATGAIQVVSVAGGSPAAKAGIRDNDVITTLEGRAISSVGQLIEWLSTAQPGQVVSIGWLDGGHRRSANVTLEAQPPQATPS